MNISLKALHQKREQLKAGLAQISDLRPGSLTARFRRCGKPNCHCASFQRWHKSASRRGRVPGSLSVTITQVIPQGPAVDRTRAQIFKRTTGDALDEVSENAAQFPG